MSLIFNRLQKKKNFDQKDGLNSSEFFFLHDLVLFDFGKVRRAIQTAKDLTLARVSVRIISLRTPHISDPLHTPIVKISCRLMNPLTMIVDPILPRKGQDFSASCNIKSETETIYLLRSYIF